MVGHYVYGSDEESYCGLISAFKLSGDAPISRPCFRCMLALIRDGQASIRLPGWDKRIKWFTTPIRTGARDTVDATL